MSVWGECLPCSFHTEQYTIFYICSAVTDPGFTLPVSFVQALCLLSGLEWGSDRWDWFEGTFPFERHSGLPFPPPFDDIYDFNNACWYELHAIHTGAGIPLDNGDCDVLNFKGNQGGAWPTTWPV